MKPVGLMLLAAVSAWVAASALGDVRLRFDVGLGLLGPLFVAGTTWLWMERTYLREPAKLTSLMIAAFGFKLVFFGVYVAAVLAWTSVRSVPFAVSFAGAFVSFHLLEAFFLHRLFQGAGASSS